MIVADEEGIAVIPKNKADEVYQIAVKRRDKDASQTLEQWQYNHKKTVAVKLAAAMTYE